MKIRVLYPTGFEGSHPDVCAGDVIDMPDGSAEAAVGAGIAEWVSGVERATAGPGEKRAVRKPAKAALGGESR